MKIPEPIKHTVEEKFVMLECPICNFIVSAEDYRACYIRYRIHLCSKHGIC